jgi:hypothetical protein
VAVTRCSAGAAPQKRSEHEGTARVSILIFAHQMKADR